MSTTTGKKARKTGGRKTDIKARHRKGKRHSYSLKTGRGKTKK